MYEQGAEYDRILGQTTGLLAQRGDEQAVALLVDVRSMALAATDEVIRTEKVIDPWLPTGDDGPAIERSTAGQLVLDVDEHLVSRFTEEVCQRIATTLSYVAERNGEENVTYVRPGLRCPRSKMTGAPHRRPARQRSPKQPGPTRVRRGRAPCRGRADVRQRQELRVYRALKDLQARFPEHDTIAIAPLPSVRLRSGNTWSPDVLVTGRGRVLIVETDGPHHRGPRRYVDDRNRDLQWQRCGVPVVRLAVEDLHDDAVLSARLHEEVLRHLRRDA